MTQDVHQRARELSLAVRIEDVSAADRQWLDAHRAECSECAAFGDALGEAVAAIRLPDVMADTRLVRSTQARVRQHALELRAHASVMRPLWIAVAMVCAWAALTTPLLWAGFAWLGATWSLPAVEWRSGFLIAWIAPTLAASLMLLASGANRGRWRAALAQYSETL